MNTDDGSPPPDYIRLAAELLEKAERPRALPIYSDGEYWALAFKKAELARRQRAKGRASRAKAVEAASYRRKHVYVLLNYVLSDRCRAEPTSNATVMALVTKLDEYGIEASETQIRRDIYENQKKSPL